MSKFYVCIAATLLLMTSCTEGLKEFPTARTTGVVTCEGKPVANVQVYFAPKATGKSAVVGKSGWGTTAEDGTFKLSTYGDDDGAVVGSHEVSVGPPHAERFPGFECDCETSSTAVLQEVSISKDADNHFKIELPKKTGRRKKQVNDDDLDDLEDDD